MQRTPICLKCTEEVEHEPVYEAPCGHKRCPSAVFHPLCLMEFRDQRHEAGYAVVGLLMRRISGEHTEASSS